MHEYFVIYNIFTLQKAIFQVEQSEHTHVHIYTHVHTLFKWHFNFLSTNYAILSEFELGVHAGLLERMHALSLPQVYPHFAFQPHSLVHSDWTQCI